MDRYLCTKCGFSAVSEQEIWECPRCFGALEKIHISEEESMQAKKEFDTIQNLASSLFSYSSFRLLFDAYEFVGVELKEKFNYIAEVFSRNGFWAFLREKDNMRRIVLLRAPPQKKENPTWNILLFAATLLTTTLAGTMLFLSFSHSLEITDPSQLLPLLLDPQIFFYGALYFAFPLMLILGMHEMGHKLTSMKNKVDATWPYFIPFPSIIGTLGAVIRSKSPMPTRNAMVQLGASGPLCGFLITIPLLVLGMSMSKLIPASETAAGMRLGESLLFNFISSLILKAPEGYDVLLHPLAFAAWVSLLVTALNLMPMGQLDGGHIVRAIVGGEYHRRISYVFVGILVVLTLFVSSGWFIWSLLGILVSSMRSPGALNEVEKLDMKSQLLALLCLLIFILTFVPTPFPR
jgi:Zn-dependent protease